MSERVDSALAALEAGRDEEALEILLVEWRASPDDGLAAAIDAVGRRVRPVVPPGMSAKARVRLWNQKAGEHRSADLALLLDDLVLVGARAAAARLETLAEWAPDPRFVDAAFRFLDEPPFPMFELGRGIDQRVFWDSLERLILQTPDPRFVRALEDPQRRPTIEAAFGDVTDMSRSLRARASSNAQSTPAIGADAIVRFCARSKTTGTSAQETLDGFLADIYAHPDDDGPRLVFADWLQDRGDPRGELIALQIGGRDPERQRALLRVHAKTWLAALASVIAYDGVVFERGFPAVGRWIGARNDLRIAAGNVAWSTFRALDVSHATYHGYPIRPIVGSIRGLRELSGIAPSEADDMEREGAQLPIEALGVAGWSTAFERMRPFPNLRRLSITRGVEAHEIGRIAALRTIAPLESLEIGASVASKGPSTQSSANGRFTWQCGGTARFVRDPAGALTHVGFELWDVERDDIEALAQLLSGFRDRTGTLRRVEVTCAKPLPADARTRLEQLSRDAGTELVLPP